MCCATLSYIVLTHNGRKVHYFGLILFVCFFLVFYQLSPSFVLFCLFCSFRRSYCLIMVLCEVCETRSIWERLERASRAPEMMCGEEQKVKRCDGDGGDEHEGDKKKVRDGKDSLRQIRQGSRKQRMRNPSLQGARRTSL